MNWRLLLAFLSSLSLCGALQAQEPADPRLEGRVLLGDSGISSGTVVLHRVTPDTAGEIDSVRVDPGGGFSFHLPSVPDPGGRGEVYFASFEYLGILYFGPAVHMAVQLDSLYLIPVYDTTTAPSQGVALPLTMRYLVLEPAQEPWLVTDLFQVENAGDKTLVPSDGGEVWSYPLPPGSHDFESGSDDLPPGAVSFDGGELHLSAPLPPGQRQYVIRYRLDERSLDLALPGAVRALELLVPEPAPPLEVEGLTAAPPFEMQPGVTYRRFTGTNLQDAHVRVVPGRQAGRFPVEWLAVIMAFVLAGGVLWALQRRPEVQPAGGGAVPPSQMSLRENLLLEVARLDEQLEEGQLVASKRQELKARRAQLLARIQSLG